MTTNHNLLRLFRKRSPISQSDIAFLFDIGQFTNISRYENGQRSPSIEFLLLYHHLFNASIEAFFERQSEIIRLATIEKLKGLISRIGSEPTSRKNAYRVKFLEQTFTRLRGKGDV